MTELGDVLGAQIKETDNIKRQMSAGIGVPVYLQVFDDDIKPIHTFTKVDDRGVGSSFVIGDSKYGKLGTGLSPQPYLGDSRVSTWRSLVNQTVNRQFVNSGKTQLRNYLISSTSTAPSKILVGSDTFTWHGSLIALKQQTYNIDIYQAFTEGAQLGSYQATLQSAELTSGSYFTELGLSGGQLFIYDTFSATIGGSGSEVRFTIGIQVGS